jgi:hypothetical protein
LHKRFCLVNGRDNPFQAEIFIPESFLSVPIEFIRIEIKVQCGRILCEDAFLNTTHNSRQVSKHKCNSCRIFWGICSISIFVHKMRPQCITNFEMRSVAALTPLIRSITVILIPSAGKGSILYRGCVEFRTVGNLLGFSGNSHYELRAFIYERFFLFPYLQSTPATTE